MTTKSKGVMIKGIKIPKDCAECPLSRVRMDSYGVLLECLLFYKEGRTTRRPSWCPLREVKDE